MSLFTYQNSIEFLRELCSRKNTFDVRYFTSPISSAVAHHPQLLPSGGDQSVIKRQEGTSCDFSSSCEYTGKLWYISKQGIKFRETLRVHPTAAQVTCMTEVLYRKQWKACAQVDCLVEVSTEGSPQLTTTSQVLMIPKMVPKTIQTALKQMIASTFETAALAFLQNQRLV